MKSETLSITDEGTHLLVEFFGEFSVEAGQQCVDAMAEACVNHGRDRVLLDCRRISGEMPLVDRVLVAEYGADHGHQMKRFALLNREGVPLPDNFVESVVVNRGMNMKAFTDPDEAERWLTA